MAAPAAPLPTALNIYNLAKPGQVLAMSLMRTYYCLPASLRARAEAHTCQVFPAWPPPRLHNSSSPVVTSRFPDMKVHTCSRETAAAMYMYGIQDILNTVISEIHREGGVWMAVHCSMSSDAVQI